MKYKEWMNQDVTINLNEFITREEYYKKYFPKDFDTKEIYMQYTMLKNTTILGRLRNLTRSISRWWQ